MSFRKAIDEISEKKEPQKWTQGIKMSQVSKVVEKIKTDIAGKKVLEAACGRAEFSVYASKFAEEVFSIDMVSFRLKDDVMECKNLTFEQMDVTAMKYEDQTFDTVVMYNAIFHLDMIIPETLAESKRVLKAGGCIYVISSFKMDKAVIEERLVPYLEKSGERYTLEADKIYTYVKIVKQEDSQF